MKRTCIDRVFGVLLVLGFVLACSASEAGFFDTVGKLVKERQQVSKSSRNVAAAVKTLYRERKSISAFAQSAATLVQAYKGIANKSAAASIPKLLDIANAIGTLVKEYGNLAPKAEKLYKGVKPDLEYLSALDGEEEHRQVSLGTTGRKIVLKTLSDGRINKLAGANGWSRVWDSIKDNPMNLFRWGKLSDEYTYGKTEGQYVLKCAQIAFETESYLHAAKSSMTQLLDIRSEINGILNGNLDALLGMGNTINKIQGAAGSAELLGDTLTSAVNNLGTRFDQLNKIQEAYVRQHQEYVNKYGTSSRATAASTGSTSTAGSAATAATAETGTASGIGTADLQTAMQMYQAAYQEYIRVTQDPDASQTARNKAINNLQKARNLVETLKANAGR